MFRLISTVIILSTFYTSFSYAKTCTNNAFIDWWDVKYYTFDIQLNTESKSIKVKSTINSSIIKLGMDTMFVDLKPEMKIQSISQNEKNVKYWNQNERGAFIVIDAKRMKVGDNFTIAILYEGKPKSAKNAPWDGGFVYKTAEKKPWWSVAVQHEGASKWLACKEYAGDEPDNGATLIFTYPKNLALHSNGKLIHGPTLNEQTLTSVFKVENPINLYNVTFYLGNYVSWNDTFSGLNGTLPITYAVLAKNEAKAKVQFSQVKTTLQTFEHLYGPYPFYQDGYKIVESPYLGMEHQSAIAYGNGFQNGYLGTDISGSGIGMQFDYIIVHETAHEWFGNSLTGLHPRDNWLQEGFATYAEVQYIEHNFGHDAAMRFHLGKRTRIRNDYPLFDSVDTCANPTTDIYDKGGYIIHMIRRQMQDDAKFQNMMRGMLKQYRHQIVTSATIENYIEEFSSLNLKPYFKQYLQTTSIPNLIIEEDGNFVKYHFENCNKDFEMLIPFVTEKKKVTYIKVGTTPKKTIYTANAATKKLWDEYLFDY